MNSILDLFMGDPVYDEQKNVIRRDFGVKNIVAIMVVGFIGYSLMGEMNPISGKGKMKGGGQSAEARAWRRNAEGQGWIAAFWSIVICVILWVINYSCRDCIMPSSWNYPYLGIFGFLWFFLFFIQAIPIVQLIRDFGKFMSGSSVSPD